MDGPDCTQHEAMPWLALAVAWVGGMALTAGWTVRTAWTIAHRPESLAWLRSAW